MTPKIDRTARAAFSEGYSRTGFESCWGPGHANRNTIVMQTTHADYNEHSLLSELSASTTSGSIRFRDFWAFFILRGGMFARNLKNPREADPELDLKSLASLGIVSSRDSSATSLLS